MFLNRLEINEKKAFLMLAHHIARSDGDFSESQESIISKYCMEMQVDDVTYEEESFNLTQILAEVESPSSQKIILLEVMALIYSDSILHEEEKKILDELIHEFGLNPSLAIVYGEWAKSILALYIQGQALIEL